MTHTELESHSTRELIDLILQLQAANEGLRAENAQLQARVAELEAKNKRPPKTPQNSSVPPSAGREGKRKRPSAQRWKHKRGPKIGHIEASRHLPGWQA